VDTSSDGIPILSCSLMDFPSQPPFLSIFLSIFLSSPFSHSSILRL
jgi:hypothetical protein